MYGLLFIAGIFLCVTIVSVLEAGKFITIRHPSAYFFFAVVLEILITLLVVKL